MPRIIDAHERRRAIARAVYGVITDEGLDAVTLANVAARAELAIGSVRHYVGSRSDLLLLTMETLRDDVRQRIRAVADTDPEAVLLELLPLDPVRRTEAVVWLAFEAAARTDDALAPLVLEVVDDVRAVHRRTVARLHPDLDDADVDAVADRLAAVLDGLTVGAVLIPARTGPDRMRRVLAAELATIRPPRGGADRPQTPERPAPGLGGGRASGVDRQA